MKALTEIIVCAECLGGLEGESLRDFQNNLLCSDCAEKYYVVCNGCLALVAADEAIAGGNDPPRIFYYCLNCPARAEESPPLSMVVDEEEVNALVNEYLALHAEEKRIKDRLEEIKESLKQIAAGFSDEHEAVTFEGEGGAAVKCTYKTSLKGITEAVAALRASLDENVFDALFTEKTSFDVNRENFEKVLSDTAGLPENLRRQIAEAVKVTETATLNVVKKGKI